MERLAYLVKAFTKDKDQGNPAGVVLDADGLTDVQMTKIASTLGFSESAFVFRSDIANFKVRFFTPIQEVNLCGHATIATAHLLRELGKIQTNSDSEEIITQEAKAGVLPVNCSDDGLIMMTQTDPVFSDTTVNRKEVAQLLGLAEGELLDYPIQTVSTGTPKLIIPVKSRNVLFGIHPKLEAIAEYCRVNNTNGFYPFTTDVIDKDSDFHARQFNPLAGINEDPITGVAAGALGAYVVEHHLSDKNHFIIEQGYVMNKAGKIIVDIGQQVQVGGYAVTFGTKKLEL